MSELRELAERWFAKAHRLEELRAYFPAGFERRMCANELLATLDAAEAENTALRARVAKLDGALRSVVISANKHAIERGIGPANMAPLDKPLRDMIEAALRGEEVQGE